MKQYDVIIVGAGILGVSLAYHLSRQRLRVVVIEKESTPAAHASGKNAGMARQLYHHPQLTEWALRSRILLPPAVLHNARKQTGSLIVGRTIPNHHEEIFEQREVILHRGKILPAVYCATDGLIDPGILVGNILRECERTFVTLLLSTSACSLEQSQSGWQCETNRGETLQAPWIVNATGAWLNSILNKSDLRVSAQPFARHLFVVGGWEPHYMPAARVGFYWDEDSEWYLRSWSERERLVSICDRAPASPDAYSVNGLLAEQLAKKLCAVLPNIAPQLCLQRSWHCFRTYTEDQLPIWGVDPAAHQFFWLGAFGGFGISTGFAAAYDAAQHICGQRCLSLPDFSPQRAREKVMKLDTYELEKKVK